MQPTFGRIRSGRALAVLVGLVGLIVTGCGNAGPDRLTTVQLTSRVGNLDDGNQVVYRDPGGWWLEYPAAMYRERVNEVPSGAGEGESHVAFANFRLAHARFPAWGVEFVMSNVELSQLPAPDSRFPVRLSYFQSVRASPGQASDSTSPRELARTIVGDGTQYPATVFIGPQASAGWRAVLGRVIASLRFPVLRPGVNPDGAYVLPPPSHYPVGSFTLLDLPTQVGYPPFFLVHAPGRVPVAPCRPRDSCTPPGAFYALFWKLEVGGNASSCDIRLDRSDDQFYCTNSTARWNRIGAVIRTPRGSSAHDPLPMILLTVSWDGQLIARFGEQGVAASPSVLRSLWPPRGHQR